MISCYGLVFVRLATVCRPTIVCLGSGHPKVYIAFIILVKPYIAPISIIGIFISILFEKLRTQNDRVTESLKS